MMAKVPLLLCSTEVLSLTCIVYTELPRCRPRSVKKKLLMKLMLAGSCKYLNAFFVVVKPSDVQSKWYGETNKAIAGVFKLACRLAKTEGKSCIIFVGMLLHFSPCLT